MSDARIRPARHTDEAALSRLDHDTWSTLHAVTAKPAASEPFFSERHLPEQDLVAEAEDGRIAGYVRLVPPTPLAVNAHVRQIQGFAVAEWARGQGVGRALIRAACAEARGRGATRITLRVLGHNTPARKLYETEGFEVEGILPGEFLIEGVYVDDVLMGRSLS
ncbi:GNAT family N-acetyltransferase [Streptomyces sp. E11-3]|uniref:GNAT family N-acetyltransferase n=1 Tax=Streptomyces sp. E11-3 TaxID=3110112 RepID=UPI00397FE608